MLCFGFRRKHTEQCSIEPRVFQLLTLSCQQGDWSWGGGYEELEGNKNQIVTQTDQRCPIPNGIILNYKQGGLAKEDCTAWTLASHQSTSVEELHCGLLVLCVILIYLIFAFIYVLLNGFYLNLSTSFFFCSSLSPLFHCARVSKWLCDAWLPAGLHHNRYLYAATHFLSLIICYFCPSLCSAVLNPAKTLGKLRLHSIHKAKKVLLLWFAIASCSWLCHDNKMDATVFCLVGLWISVSYVLVYQSGKWKRETRLNLCACVECYFTTFAE